MPRPTLKGVRVEGTILLLFEAVIRRSRISAPPRPDRRPSAQIAPARSPTWFDDVLANFQHSDLVDLCLVFKANSKKMVPFLRQKRKQTKRR
jgi:hypothetical protein